MSKMYKVKLSIISSEPDSFHIFVSAKVNRQRANLILDTGASHSCFNQSFLDSLTQNLKAKTQQGKCVSIGSIDNSINLYTLPTLSLGHFKVEEYDVVAISLDNVNDTLDSENIPVIDGILGCDFLVKYHAIIDISQKMLFLTR